MKRTDFVEEVFSTLEKTHINLYHDIRRDEFQMHKEIFLQECEQLDEIHFEAGINRLFALFRDAHTMPTIKNTLLVDAHTKFYHDNFYIFNQSTYKFEKITQINGFDINYATSKMAELLCYETNERKNFLIKNWLCSVKFLAFVDISKLSDEQIVYTTENGEVVAKLINSFVKSKSRYYEFSYDDILVVKYRRCFEMPDYSFSDFINDIKNACSILPKACLVDVRGNEGGNSELVKPLLYWLKENGIKTYVLMNFGTFSSGRHLVAFFKKELNATLLGTGIGSPAVAYGNPEKFYVDGKEFLASTKYFDYSEIFGTRGVIKPDVLIEQTIERLNKGEDGQFLKALDYIREQENIV